jgi:oligopeptide transport system permease protein
VSCSGFASPRSRFPPYEHIGQPLHDQHVPGFVVTIPSELYHSPDFRGITREMQYPSTLHWLGTDDSGQDILARLLKGWQVMLIVVIVVEVQNVVLGIFFGVLAGYFGGLIDLLLARFPDVMFAFPSTLLAILVGGIFGPSFDHLCLLGIDFGPYGRVILLCFVLGVTIWPQMARLVRSQTLQLKEQPYVEAAHSCGTSTMKIILRHLVPNMGGVILVSAMLDVMGNIGVEGAFSFLDLAWV